MNNELDFLSPYKDFLALWYEYLYIIRALKIADPYKVVNTEKEMKPSSIIFKGTDAINFKIEDKIKFYSELINSDELSISYFLIFYAKAEAILSEIEPLDDVWGYKVQFAQPKGGFFNNLTFEEYLDANKQAISQISAVRNIWIHSGGKVDKDYLSKKEKYFPTINTALDKLPSGTFFIEKVKQTASLGIGDVFPIDIYYLAFTQMFLLDRIFLKMGAYHKFFSKDGAETNIHYEFDLLPVFCSNFRKEQSD
jgi:hypothetical protein